MALTLNDDVFGKLLPRKVELLVTTEDVLQRCAAPEILLLETELLAGVHVVVRVENARNVLRLGAALDRRLIVARIERVEVKALDGLGRPETQVGSVFGRESRNWDIVRNGQAFHATRPYGAVGVGHGLDVAVEAHRVGDVQARDLPGVLAVQPWVRSLELLTSV